jgi:DNA-binding MarR family transcriptional regulator
MARSTSGGAASSDGFVADLESHQLQSVHEQYADLEHPSLPVVATAIFRANKIVNSKMAEALSSLDLAPDRFAVLGILANTEGGKLSLSDIGRAVLSHPATTTYIVDTLEKRGLVKRQPDPRDRRGVLAQVTPAGRELVKRATKALEATSWGVEELSDAEAASLAIALSRLHPKT